MIRTWYSNRDAKANLNIQACVSSTSTLRHAYVHTTPAKNGTYPNWEWDELDPAMEFKLTTCAKWDGTSKSKSKSKRVVTEHTLRKVVG